MKKNTSIPVPLLPVLLFSAAIAGLFCTAGVAGSPTATVRVGKHADFIRIVFTSDEESVQRASVSLTPGNSIKVTFPSAVAVSTQKGPLKSESNSDIGRNVKIALSGNTSVLTVENLDDISVTKLSLPARLIIDARTNQSSRQRPLTEGAAGVVAPSPSVAFGTFVIDPGHGGFNAGIRADNFTEKDAVLTLAKELAGALGKMGKKVFLTRKSDQNVSLKKRGRYANGKSPDIFISIHVTQGNEFVVYSRPAGLQKPNSGTSADAVSPVSRETDRGLGAAVAQHLKAGLKINASHEELRVSLLETVKAPALMIELPNPGVFKYDKPGRELFINALLSGIAQAAPGKPAGVTENF